jgi:hypothetical protein
MKTTHLHGNTRWRVLLFPALQLSNLKVKTNHLFTRLVLTKLLENSAKARPVKERRHFVMSKVLCYHKLPLCITEKPFSVGWVNRINLVQFKSSNIRTKRHMRYKSMLCQWNVFELVTTINLSSAAPMMALSQFLVFRKRTQGKKIKTYPPSSIQSSF